MQFPLSIVVLPSPCKREIDCSIQSEGTKDIMELYVRKILEHFNLDGALVLKKKIRNVPGITMYQLILAYISTYNVEEAATFLGYSTNPVKEVTRKYLANLFPQKLTGWSCGGKWNWRNELLSVIDYKCCSKCEEIKSIDRFGGHKWTLYTSSCKACLLLKSKKEKEYIFIRTAKWSNKQKIIDIYNNCPEGFHVDHILPLRGKLVSGLHVENNLQYLPAEENIRKKNSYIVV